MNRFFQHLRILLGGIDALTIYFTLIAGEGVLSRYFSLTGHKDFVLFALYEAGAWVAVAFFSKLYRQENISSFEAFLRETAKTFIYFLLLTLVYFSSIVVSKTFLLLFATAIPAVLFMNRALYFGLLQYLKSNRYPSNKLVIVGYNALSKSLVEELEKDTLNKQIVGFCEDADNVTELSHYPILSDVRGVLNVCKQHGVKEIYSTIAPEKNPYLYHVIQTAEQHCIRFKLVPDFSLFINRQAHLDYVRHIPVISLRQEPLEDVTNRMLKRLFDFMFSLVVVVLVLSWLVPLVGILIKLSSRGPVFFTQERTGKDNQPFVCFKFRSMIVNQQAHVHQATKGDARITWIGKFLRKTNLDEFPQFLNVLRGDMSIVGPRPHMLKHTDEYSKLIGQYMVRQFVKPGITGWAQVNGFRGETKDVEQMQNRVEHDIWYMENWSMWLDLRIILKTVFNTIKGEENAG